MPLVEPAPHPPRAGFRARRPAAWWLIIGVCLTAVIACGAEEAKDAVISELAAGSWACSPDADGASEQPFTVQIEDNGTFGVSIEPDPAAEDASPPSDEITGTWAIEDGDLEWSFDARQDLGKTRIDGFDSLTLDSSELTLTNPGIFEANDGADDPADKQDVIIDANGTNSVTLSVPGGEPWTCNRQ